MKKTAAVGLLSMALLASIEELAATRGTTVKGQADLELLLRDVRVVDPREKEDYWKRPLRAKFVSQGVFHVVSDGPDMTPNTFDDMSSAERSDAYIDRVFPNQFNP